MGWPTRWRLALTVRIDMRVAIVMMVEVNQGFILSFGKSILEVQWWKIWNLVHSNDRFLWDILLLLL